MEPTNSIIALCAIFICAYLYLLYKITGRKRNSKNLIFAFLAIFVFGVACHMELFRLVAADQDFISSFWTRVLFSMQYSLEMFIANTVVIKTDILKLMQDHPDLFYTYLTIYFSAILTSGFVIFHFLPRRLFNRVWLGRNRYKSIGRKTHIFVGINTPSLYLASDIRGNKETSKDDIIFIDVPDEQDNPRGISIWDFISAFFKENKEHEKLDNFVVLKAGKGLSKISLWLRNEKNSIYFLSENQSKNLMMFEELWGYKYLKELKDLSAVKCHIYCHAKKEGLVNRYDTIADLENQVTIIDSSYLSVEYMKKGTSREFLPVKYVDVATDGDRKLGYVTSDLNCAIIGFGETGREALKFLYEFGAFPDVNKKKSPFKCHIFDKEDMLYPGNSSLTDYQDPDAKEVEVVHHNLDVSRVEFWKQLATLINNLNYIVVCLGNDRLNMQVAIDLAEFAVTNGRNVSDKFVIAVKQMEVSPLIKTTMESANATFDGCIKIFGLSQEIWKLNVITNDAMSKEAEMFYTSYAALSEEFERKKAAEDNFEYKSRTWDERNEGLVSVDYAKRSKTHRQVAQDYSNCLHKSTKKALCSLGREAADEILSVNVGENHCVGSHSDILEYLAIGEHLRWNASHIILGYRPTDLAEDYDGDLRKLHNCLKPYSQLSEDTRHYDWLVVKNSL